MSERDEGYLPQAPKLNTYFVICPERQVNPEAILGGNRKPLPAHLGETAVGVLMKRRDQYTTTKNAPLEEIDSLCIKSKGDLVLGAAAIISHHAEQNGATDVEAIHYAGVAGCGVIVAFQDLIARMKAKQSGGPFSEEAYRDSAKKSVRTLLRMAKASRDADGALTASASTLTIKQIRSKRHEEKYANLQFDDSFFIMDDDGFVDLKSDKKTMRRVRDGAGKNIDFSPNKNHALFGCPYRQQIVFLYPRILNAMLGNGFPQEAYALAQREVA